jgi:guanine deaminase
VTPRFAPTSTDLQLQLAGQLAKEHPTVHVHTHLCENTEEVNLVKALFDGRDYLGVYQDNGLVTSKSIFAHCVHVSEEHLQALASAGSSIAFCPSSNCFLGSGLFPLERALAFGVKVGLATDVGAGTSLSMLKTMGDAYKVIQLRQQQDKQQQQEQHQQLHSLSPLHLFHLATMGSAFALGIHNEVQVPATRRACASNFSCCACDCWRSSPSRAACCVPHAVHVRRDGDRAGGQLRA